jgi:predicted NAD/FAD-binding protein
VIGSGIAGLTCAHVLGPLHDVVLFEADSRLGGHSNTVDVDDPSAGTLAVDTGFIVHNDRNYPNLVRLFEELGVATIDTEMSFGVSDRDPRSSTFGFTYRATNLNTIFADRGNLTSAAMWRMLADIVRFYRHARRFLRHPDPGVSLEEFLEQGRYSRDFIELHLLPMGASVWSASPSTFAEFPAQALLTFLKNHGLLGFGKRPQWRSVVGGSRTYVDAIAAQFAGTIRFSTPVVAVTRHESGGVAVSTESSTESFDAVILAVHSDQALAMITEPSLVDKEVLGSIGYQRNRATLHTDTSMLPTNRQAWAAWNYDRRASQSHQATLTYDMTALQHLPGSRRYLVSLNSDEFIDPDSVITSIDYAHPVFDRAAIEAQARRNEIDGVGGVYFCGAWLGYGFHEDGITSGLRVCEQLGVRWPAGAT